MKLPSQLRKNKRAFSLLEIIISVFIISILIFGIINLKTHFDTNQNQKINKIKKKRKIYDAILYIENKLKNIDEFEYINDDSYKNMILFTRKSRYKNKIKGYTYFFFELKNKKLHYRANQSNIPLAIKNYNSFSKTNYIAEDIGNFEINYKDGLFKVKIIDIFGNEINKTILSGVYNE